MYWMDTESFAILGRTSARVYDTGNMCLSYPVMMYCNTSFSEISHSLLMSLNESKAKKLQYDMREGIQHSGSGYMD
jgi:hypothetical protein